MAYSEALLAKYRSETFRSPSCPYCNGSRDATIKHINPKRKPESPWDFWNNIVCASTNNSNNNNNNNNNNKIERRPVYVVGPMVDQSELPFRMLCRRYGATLAYSPMLHAKSAAESASYRARYFSTTPHRAHDNNKENNNNEEEEERDHPLFVQFCGNDPDTILAAARHVECRCEAVDVNLGCPQGIARRGHYGAFLMEDWELIHNILHRLAVELRVPVTAKMRVFDDTALTLRYAEMLRDAGVAVLCVHGRERHNKRGPADVEKIKKVCEHLRGSIPVIGNGNVFTFEDVQANLRRTRCDGYMCAEPLLWEPRLFAAGDVFNNLLKLRSGRCFAECRAARLEGIRVAHEYLQLVRRYPVDLGFVKAHLFKMLFHSYEMHPELHAWLTCFSTHNNNNNNNNNNNEINNNSSISTENNNNNINSDSSSSSISNENNGEKPEFFTAALGALCRHLDELRAAELSCGVEGPQPKRAQTKTTTTEREPPDVFAGDEVLGIDFG